MCATCAPGDQRKSIVDKRAECSRSVQPQSPASPVLPALRPRLAEERCGCSVYRGKSRTNADMVIPATGETIGLHAYWDRMFADIRGSDFDRKHGVEIVRVNGIVYDKEKGMYKRIREKYCRPLVPWTQYNQRRGTRSNEAHFQINSMWLGLACQRGRRFTHARFCARQLSGRIAAEVAGGSCQERRKDILSGYDLDGHHGREG
jgi:hypothetical protein